MPVDSLNIAQPSANGVPQQPLQSFFTALHQNGFSVTPEQMIAAGKLVDQFAPQVANEVELSIYLSPLFARNEEEQLQFAEIFNAHFIRTDIAPLPLTPLKRLLQQLAKYNSQYALGLGLFSVISILAMWYANKHPAKLDRNAFQFYIKEKNSDSSLKSAVSEFQMTADSLLTVWVAHSTSDSVDGVRFETSYQWGDGTTVDTIPSHKYSSEGNFTLSAYSAVHRHDQLQFVDTSTALVRVCRSSNLVQIISPENRDLFAVGEKIQLRAAITGGTPDRVLWGADDDTIGYGNTFDTSYLSEGSYTIGCAAIYDSINSPCTVYSNITFTVQDPNKPVYTATISPTVGATAIDRLYRVKSIWYWWVAGIGLAAFIASLIVAMRSNNRKAKQQQQKTVAADRVEQAYDQLLQSFAGKKIPAEMPFRNKNYLPVPEPEITEAAIQLRRRVHGGAFFLDIQKTINKAVRKAGFFEPVYSPRLHQSEYLVLIDESHVNSQQVKLFDYLTDLLKKQNVFLEKYYYRYEPKECYNLSEPNGISLEKLAEKYSRHTLLIFGNAYQLLYTYYPVFNDEYLQLLNRWQNKAIITPVPLPDWTDKEKKALVPQMPVLPVDVAGLLELMPLLFSGESGEVLTTLQQQRKDFYGTASIDFENINSLEQYCVDVSWANVEENGKPVNVLFQWVAALTVYPRIRWEVTLAIGKALLDKYGKPEELNFTTLLRLARIKWMAEGRLPDETRLELLKLLPPDNEVLARQTILALLAEIPEVDLDETHFAWQEKEIQRITNEFILYAYDSQKYAAYKPSEELYGKLLAEKKIKDVISRLYLKNGESEKWLTPINKTTGADQETGVPLEAYFHSDEVRPDTITNKERWLIRTGIGIAFLSGLGLVFLFALDLLHTVRFPLFMYKSSVRSNIRFETKASDSIRSGLVNINVSGSYYTVSVDSAITGNLLIDDTMKKVVVQFDGQQVLDTAINITYNSYTIRLNSNDPETLNRQTTIAIYTDKCLADFAQYQKILLAADSTFEVMKAAGNNNGSGDCHYYLSYKPGVSEAIIGKIIAALKQSGVNIIVDKKLSGWNTPEQVRIYSAVENVPEVRKSVVYIQYNMESRAAAASRNRLTQCLSGSFTFLDAQYKPNLLGFYRNEIRYYRSSFLDSIKPLLACLKQIYPKKEFVATQISGGQSALDASAKIWIYDAQDTIDTSSSNTANQVVKVSIAYGDQVSMPGTGYMHVGPFVKNSKGEIFFICVGNDLPAINAEVRRPTRIINAPPVGVLYAKSSTHTRIGLVKITKSNVNIDYGHGPIRGSKTVAVGDKVKLYDPLTGTTISGAGTIGEVIATNLATTLMNGKQALRITGAFSTSVPSASNSDGSLLVNDNNLAVGILIGGDEKTTMFIPIGTLLKEFNVILITNDQSPVQAN